MKLKSWFKMDNSSSTKRGTRFLDGHKPDQKTFEELLETFTAKTESSDRAKVNDDSKDIEELAGLSVLANDEDIHNKRVQDEEKTIVVGPDQLPESISDDTASFNCEELNFTDNLPLTVEENFDNNKKITYKSKLSDDFKTFLQSVFSKIEDISNDLSSLISTVSSLSTQVTTNTANISLLSGNTINNVLPIGSVLAYPVFTPPANFLKCNGQILERADYPLLFDVIGHNYSNLDLITPADQFMLPDWNSVDANGIGRTLTGTNIASKMTLNGTGGTGGKSKISLVKENLPFHTHSMDFDSSTQAMDSGSYSNNHLKIFAQRGTYSGGSGENGIKYTFNNVFKNSDPKQPVYGNNPDGYAVHVPINNHTHRVKGTTEGVNGIGSGSAQIDIMNPYATIVWVIKAL